MELNLKGKVAIVTGGSKGIGKGIAASLLQEGATVVITARNADELEDTAAMFRLQGKDVLAVVADMTKEADLQRLVNTTVQQLGHIDILVNNAGGIDAFGPLDTISMSQWRQVFEVNFFGLVALTQLVIPHMKKQGGGNSMNDAVSLLAAITGEDFKVYVLKGIHQEKNPHITLAMGGELFHVNVKNGRQGQDNLFTVVGISVGKTAKDDPEWTVVK